MLSKIITFLDIVFSWILYLLSFLFPKSKKVWVFTGWHKFEDKETFADNSKYLFLYASQFEKEIMPIWITRDLNLIKHLREKGYKAFHINSFKGIFYSLRAKHTIIDAIMQRENWKFSGRSRIIQLWHGRAIKDVNLHKDKSLKNLILNPSQYVKFWKITSSSKYVNGLMEKVFNQNDIITTGYPRNDIFFREIIDSEIDCHLDILKLIKDSSDKKFILYAPTFRRGNQNYKIDDFFSSQELSTWLESNNIIMLLSFHPKYKGQLRKQIYKNILPIDDQDPYPLFSKIDMLITDYSSSFVDFLLTNKPMVFFSYDLEEYKETSGLSIDYQSHMPGPIVSHLDNILPTIKQTLTNDNFREKRLETCNLYHQYRDGNASKRIVDYLISHS